MCMNGILWLALEPQITPVPYRYAPARHLHVTLLYGVTRRCWDEWIGRRVSIALIAECWNDRIQAAKVLLPDPYAAIATNPVPHLTLSHLNGVKPVESNQMLSLPHHEAILDVSVETVVAFRPLR